MGKSQHACSFVPLAVTNMSDSTLCVAGVNPETNKWIRPVEPGFHCLFENHLHYFPQNTKVKACFHAAQPRPESDDPYGLHAEDSPITERPEILSVLAATTKLEILNNVADTNLLNEVGVPGRSMFLVRVKDLKIDLHNESDFRLIYFQGGDTNLTLFRDHLDSNFPSIGISSKGIPCRMRGCNEFIRSIREDGHIIGMAQILAPHPDVEVYFAFSLSGLFEGKHWMILAGIHVVGEEIWL
jgi:hypothetical protein